MTWRLLVRFHLLPWMSSWARAARQGPLMLGVVGFLVLFIAGLTLSGRPLVSLPSGDLDSAAMFLGLTGVVASLFWAAGRGNEERWALFFQARPRGASMYQTFRLARALSAWFLGGLIVAVVSGPSLLTVSVSVLVGPVFAAGLLLFVGLAPRLPHSTPSFFSPLPGLAAWWVREPLLNVVPVVAWATLVSWVLLGGAGFAWSDRPPAAALLLDFGWVTVMALFWSESVSRIPYAFFRLARAPFHRVFTAVVGPSVVITLVVALIGASLSATPSEALRCFVLTTTGTAFWLMYWLRWGPANLAHLMLFFTVFVAGVALERDWWLAWAVLQTLGAFGAGVSWRTKFYEGETDAGA